MKKKFAFLLMGPHYDPSQHQAVFETERQFTYIYTVKDFEQARQKVQELMHEGVGAIELCGAFGKEGAQELTQLTQNKIAIGYIVHDPSQDSLFDAFFGSKK